MNRYYAVGPRVARGQLFGIGVTWGPVPPWPGQVPRTSSAKEVKKPCPRQIAWIHRPGITIPFVSCMVLPSTYRAEVDYA